MKQMTWIYVAIVCHADVGVTGVTTKCPLSNLRHSRPTRRFHSADLPGKIMKLIVVDYVGRIGLYPSAHAHQRRMSYVYLLR